ncbi:MAG: PhoU domain protein [Candidatus Bathyarchaeota archaeon BA1]|nr:MAG: PhoU domain protein [Candidatus Bathyarchaeota archaeon BA1]
MAARGMRAKISLKSPGQIVGYRLVTKGIEEMADYAENMARETLGIKDEEYSSHQDILEGLFEFNELIQNISDKTMKARLIGDIKLANNVIETARLANETERELVKKILEEVSNINVAVALKSIAWSLRQIARMCDVITEITVNTILGTSSEICRLERL